MEHNFIIVTSEGKVGQAAQISLGPIGKALRNPAFAQQLAASMIQPLRTRIDYQGIARRIFQVEQLPQGALPIYDKEPDGK
jgi:hypothetical protein